MTNGISSHSIFCPYPYLTARGYCLSDLSRVATPRPVLLGRVQVISSHQWMPGTHTCTHTTRLWYGGKGIGQFLWDDGVKRDEDGFDLSHIRWSLAGFADSRCHLQRIY